jgi:signal transduction histidine kinase
MTRRILAALVGFTAVLLAAVVVPLGAFAAHHDEQVFVERTQAAAFAIANQAEERLADGHDDSSQIPLTVATPGDRVSVFDVEGRPVSDTADEVRISADDRSGALLGQRSKHWLDHPDRLLVVLPVTSSGRVVGVAALVRPAASLNSEQTRLWLGLSAAGVTALLAAAVLALGLARWVGRPLRRLEAAAGRLGEGSLSSRAATETGPAEIRQLAATFNLMAGRLEGLLASQRNVLADVSHQLRTPLAALRLRLELLRQDAVGATGADLDRTLAEVNRLSHLVDGLLAVAKAENTTATPRVTDVTAVTAGRVEAWKPVADEGDVELSLELSLEISPPILAMTTPGHLEQILDNLLANAIDATPAAGRISVAVSHIGSRVRIMVSDTGPGMTSTQREQALRRFWSQAPAGHDSPGDRHGSGLGLAIADRLVTVDQGKLTLGERTGDGASGLVATVDLPAANHARPAPVS